MTSYGYLSRFPEDGAHPKAVAGNKTNLWAYLTINNNIMVKK
jgi:hypothetical protein